jgi:serine/threonine-protein kinase
MSEAFEREVIGLRVGGKYVVERVLGRGGMGVVALGHHEELKRRVAIKFMFAAQRDPAMVARFMREGQLAAQLHSEHVVRVFDVGRLDNGTPYMVMEYLEGRSLAEELAASGPLPVATAIDYTAQALEAIAEAHALGVVHRDLKPDNLFVVRKGGAARTVKVLDFGISKGGDQAESQSLTHTSTLLGSPSYMSPEQIRDSKSVDARSDIWSLGVLFYELIEGKLPFDAMSVGELFGKIQFVDPSPTVLAPPELGLVLRRCLARDPQARFANVSELWRALAPFGSRASERSLEVIDALLAPTEAGDAVNAEDPTVAAVAVSKPYSERPAASATTVRDGGPTAHDGLTPHGGIALHDGIALHAGLAAHGGLAARQTADLGSVSVAVAPGTAPRSRRAAVIVLAACAALAAVAAGVSVVVRRPSAPGTTTAGKATSGLVATPSATATFASEPGPQVALEPLMPAVPHDAGAATAAAPHDAGASPTIKATPKPAKPTGAGAPPPETDRGF